MEAHRVPRLEPNEQSLVGTTAPSTCCHLTFPGCRRGPTTPTFRGTHLAGYNSTAKATDTPQGHVSLERE
jgi:hypothetical protein